MILTPAEVGYQSCPHITTERMQGLGSSWVFWKGRDRPASAIFKDLTRWLQSPGHHEMSGEYALW